MHPMSFGCPVWQFAEFFCVFCMCVCRFIFTSTTFTRMVSLFDAVQIVLRDGFLGLDRVAKQNNASWFFSPKNAKLKLQIVEHKYVTVKKLHHMIFWCIESKWMCCFWKLIFFVIEKCLFRPDSFDGKYFVLVLSFHWGLFSTVCVSVSEFIFISKIFLVKIQHQNNKW